MDIDLSSFSRQDKLKMLKKLEIRDLMLLFASKYHRDNKGHKLVFDDRFRHMEEAYNLHPLYDFVVQEASTQIGKSLNIVQYCLAASVAGLQVMVILPTKKFKDAYYQEKFASAIAMSPEYRAYKKDSVANSNDLMQFGRGMIKFVSANVTADMGSSFAADSIVIDEYDQICSKGLENLPLAFGRMDASPYKFVRIISNSKNGETHKYIQKSDKRVRMAPCNVCNEYSELDFFKTVVKREYDAEDNVINVKLRDETWYPGCKRDILVKCPCEGCDGDLERLSEDCYWQPTAFSEEDIVGYTKPSMISGLVRISKLWQEYKEAMDDPARMAAFYFRRLAVPFESVGNKVSESGIKKCCMDKDFTFQIKSVDKAGECYDLHDLTLENRNKSEFDQTKCVMGVDVSPTHLDICVASVEKNGLKLQYVAKMDPVEKHNLLGLITRYNIKVGVIDIGPERLYANWLQDATEIPVWKCKYQGAGDDRDAKENWDDFIYTVDRTEALDEANGLIKTKQLLIPTNFELILEGSWKEELLALSRKMSEDKKGKSKVYWDGSNNDHSFHSLAYMNIAYKLLSSSKELDLDDIYIG